MKKITTVLLFLSTIYVNIVNAQIFLDKEIYLVDSITKETVAQNDLDMLDSILPLYKSEGVDTLKMKYISYIIEQSWNIEIWPRYNHFLKEKN